MYSTTNYNFKPKLNSKRAPSRQAEVSLRNENSGFKANPYVKSKNEGLCKVMIVLPKNLKTKSGSGSKGKRSLLIATPSLGQQELIRNDPNQAKNKDLADDIADTPPPCQNDESNKNDVFESMYPYLDINHVNVKNDAPDGSSQNIIIVTSKIKDVNNSFDKFKEHSLLSESNSRYGGFD